jgi:hypothetical protein
MIFTASASFDPRAMHSLTTLKEPFPNVRPTLYFSAAAEKA